jgi:hypothetical protein
MNDPLVAQLLNDFRIHIYNADYSQELLVVRVPPPANP